MWPLNGPAAGLPVNRPQPHREVPAGGGGDGRRGRERNAQCCLDIVADWLGHGLAVEGPKPHRAVEVQLRLCLCRRGREYDSRNPTRDLALERPGRRLTVKRPQPHRAVLAAGGDACAVGAERDRRSVARWDQYRRRANSRNSSAAHILFTEPASRQLFLCLSWQDAAADPAAVGLWCEFRGRH